MSWAAEELKAAELGDKRRNKRLIKIVEDLAACPEESIPQASRDAAAVQGAYDFFDNPRIKASDILAAHTKSTIERAKQNSLVLAIQDTTELDFSNHKGKRGLGPISNPLASGLKVHSVLCVSDEGVPLGLLHQQVWARSKKDPAAKKTNKVKAITEKESHRWLEGLEIAQQEIPSQTRVVMVGDREADIYELFAQPRRLGSEFLIRACHNRNIKTTSTQPEAQKLLAAINQVQPSGVIPLEVQRTPNRKARTAILTIRLATYLLQPPQNATARNLEPLKVQIILATEEAPPLGEKPINWLLVSTLPVTDFPQACLCLKWYSYRWLIERYFFVLKSGCRLEELQLETSARLMRALATYAIVAWRLLWLTYLARINPLSPATEAFQTHEWQTLYCVTHQTPIAPETPPSLHECVMWIAKLGGFLGRKGDGDPGVKTIWIGLRKLHNMVRVWSICQDKST